MAINWDNTLQIAHMKSVCGNKRQVQQEQYVPSQMEEALLMILLPMEEQHQVDCTQ